MLCSITDLKNKQVVNMEDGSVLGFVGDIEIDTETGNVNSIIIFGKLRLMGFLGRDEDMEISWNKIEVIGEETILVNGPIIYTSSKKRKN